jgi:hypothetical protein
MCFEIQVFLYLRLGVYFKIVFHVCNLPWVSFCKLLRCPHDAGENNTVTFEEHLAYTLKCQKSWDRYLVSCRTPSSPAKCSNSTCLESKSGRKTSGEMLSHAIWIVTIEDVVFWDMTPRGSSKNNRRLGGTYSLHLQGNESSLFSSQKGYGSRQTTKRVFCDGSEAYPSCELGRVRVSSLRLRSYVLPKRRLFLLEPHGVISQKTTSPVFSCYFPCAKPGLMYLYSCSYSGMKCPVFEVGSFQET